MVQNPKKQKFFLSLSRGRGSDTKVIKITFLMPSLSVVSSTLYHKIFKESQMELCSLATGQSQAFRLSPCLAIFRLTKYPSKLSPTWNLVYLFPLNIWLIFLASITSVVVFFTFSSMVFKNLGLKTYNEEIQLFPFRY